MSIQNIEQYYSKVDKIKQFGGSQNEGSLSPAFRNLLEQYCSDRGLELIDKLDYRTRFDTLVYPDGTIKDALRGDWGYWESKDQYDSLDEEIQDKINKGYPTNNILFEDSQTAVLYQNGLEIKRVKIRDSYALDKLLISFLNYQPKDVREFREAIDKFKEDLPYILKELRQLIDYQTAVNKIFSQAIEDFLELCRESINPHIVQADIREMIIQHILTEDIFISVFNNPWYHQENNIAKELNRLTNTFFVGDIRQNILMKIEPYIKIIKAKASKIQDHHEKQSFLKVVYETFYRTYSPEKADRLGIIFTPNEIVKFMVESSDYLLWNMFERTIGDKNVEILDPATGTGTFVTEIIEYIPKTLLDYKYQNELHCNEVAILPYYVANLNIEYTYAQKMEKYEEFKNICFVDTLDNLGFSYKYKQHKLLGIGVDNLQRIKRQNERTISIVIGNPPYNANQLNENDNNANRPYPGIDKLIKNTYIKYSEAQKTKSYDMYIRFLRWASNRINKNGIIAFISNNSFVNRDAHDGVRKVLEDEFNEIYIIDYKGNANTSGEQRKKEGGNIFANKIKVGVAIYFLIRKEGLKGCKISYYGLNDYLKYQDKRDYLISHKFKDIDFKPIHPDNKHNWLGQLEVKWDNLLPIASNQTKAVNSESGINAIFKLFSLGVSTNRDDWVYDFNKDLLQQKIKYLIKTYNEQIDNTDYDKLDELDNQLDYSIKWSDSLKHRLVQKKRLKYDDDLIINILKRLFVSQWYYSEKGLSDRLTSNHFEMFGLELTKQNKLIIINTGNKPFNVISTKYLVDLHFNGDSQCFPLYRYDIDGNSLDNITDWSLTQFKVHYRDDTITKEDIFNYVYSVLHSPVYREKYAMNLKKDFPHIPYYNNFWKWSAWGKQLINLHVNYEQAQQFNKIKQSENLDVLKKTNIITKVKLKADVPNSAILIDNVTTLSNIPLQAWDYKLGNLSAIEHVLESFKKRTPKDSSILTDYYQYHFADYKDRVINLIKKLCTISIETMKIIEEMKADED